MSEELVGAIAVIGMSGRFPEAPDINSFWAKLRDGEECIRRFTPEELDAAGVSPELRDHPDFVPVSATISDADCFDAGYFGFSPSEALMLDPQIRVFMETVHHCIEHAGYDPDRSEDRIGVFAGMSMNTHIHRMVAAGMLQPAGILQARILNDKDFLSTWTAYKLNLTGPAVNLQNACSTSLVALHLACQSLLNGESDMAIAGGVTVDATIQTGYVHQQGGIFSSDGRCRAFDAQSEGTVAGNGSGAVLLKDLEKAQEDGDHIEAIILGSALNNDGSLKISYTAPSLDGEAGVVTEAIGVSGVDPEEIDYVETHGTGTPLGDPIEIQALTEAFRAEGAERDGYCAVGSVKTNIGHLDAAAAVASVIKTIMAMKHRTIPASLHYTAPNPQIDFANSPFYVNAQTAPWPERNHPRRAGVSSFGVGGTNAHALLQEAPAIRQSGPSREFCVLPLAAKTASAADRQRADLAAHLRAHDDLNLADAAYTLQVGRRLHRHRRATVAATLTEAATLLEQPNRPGFALRTPENPPPLVFLFPGQGAQHPRMLHHLYQHEPVFAQNLDRCFEILRTKAGLDLKTLLYQTDDLEAAARGLRRTRNTQPALFATAYALAELWRSWGVQPESMFGHSVGEYVAATLAGVFSLEDALLLVARRGQLMDQLPAGAMTAAFMTEDELQPHLGDCDLAAVNGAALCVASGPPDAVSALETRLADAGKRFRRLHVSQAFHSSMMDPILNNFKDLVKQAKPAEPKLPFVSCLTGDWITPDQATDPAYWADQLRGTVRFHAGLQTLRTNADRVFLEVGPSKTLRDIIAQSEDAPVAVASARAPRDDLNDRRVLAEALASVWVAGVDIDWSAYYGDEIRNRVGLPGYPFARTAFRIEGGVETAVETEETQTQAPRFPRPEIDQAYTAPEGDMEQGLADIWAEVLGLDRVGRDDPFFELGGNSLMGVTLINRVQNWCGRDLQIADLMEAPTIAGMAAILADRDAAAPNEPAITRSDRRADESGADEVDDDLENLSDEELDALLAAQEAEENEEENEDTR